MRHLLDIDGLETETLEALIERACALSDGAAPGRLDATVANLFYEPSTRTRVSFELAAARLGMRVVNIELDRSSASKGESLEDTAATLAAMDVDALVLRHPEGGRPARLVERFDHARVINAGDGSHAHPSQALLDAATLKARRLEFERLKIAMVGDIVHSRVAASALRLWERLGVPEIRLAGPPDFLPERAPAANASLHGSLASAVDGADVVVMLRVQHERMDRSAWPDRGAYFADWGLTEAVLDKAAPDCLVMHPGPINRGMEIASSVADGDRSLILEQVRMGVFTRMAIFEWLLDRR